MFDIGFSEIVVIGVVALVVIGPERLPKTARTLGLLYGRLQRYVNDVKADISREMELDELRRLQREMQGAAHEFEQSVKTAANDVATGVRNVERELNAGAVEAHDARAPDATPATPLPPAADATPPRQAPLPGFDKI
ncbi:MAG: Sec-independent protein translocase protein TatB [Burkholderiales bacterium]